MESGKKTAVLDHSETIEDHELEVDGKKLREKKTKTKKRKTTQEEVGFERGTGGEEASSLSWQCSTTTVQAMQGSYLSKKLISDKT